MYWHGLNLEELVYHIVPWIISVASFVASIGFVGARVLDNRITLSKHDTLINKLLIDTAQFEIINKRLDKQDQILEQLQSTTTKSSNDISWIKDRFIHK